MTTLVRYMYSRLALAFCGVMAALIVNEMLYKTKELYHLVFANVISMTELLIVWTTLMPVVIYQVGPQIVMVALLIRYYLWRQHNEVLSMRAMGLSCWQIALPGIMVGVCATVVSAVMGCFLLPVSFDRAMEIRAAAQTRIAPGILVEGVPNSITPEMTLSFQRWISTDIVGEVVVTQDRKPADFTFVVAERAEFVERDGTYVLILQNGSQLTHKSAEDVHQVSFNELSIPLTAPERVVAPGNGFYDQPIWKLLNPPQQARENPRSLGVWLSEGHHRIINPLRCVSCALLLLGVLIPGLQGYAELIFRLLIAVGLAFAENAVSTIAFVFAQHHAAICPYLYLLPLTTGGLGAILLYLGDRHHPRWLRTPKFRRAKPPDAGSDGYVPVAMFADRASLE